jgi:hypothetical protein
VTQQLPPVTIKAGSATAMPFMFVKQSRPVPTRTIVVDSEPQGAFILIDGVRKGQTPNKILVPADLDSIEIRFPDETEARPVILDKKTTKYFVRQKPEAPVTSVDAGVEPDVSQEVDDAGEETPEDTTASVTLLTFVVDPPAAIVKIAGNVEGDRRREVPWRSWTSYEVSMEGYETFTNKVLAKQKGNQRVQVALKKKAELQGETSDTGEKFMVTIVPRTNTGDAIFCDWTVDTKPIAADGIALKISLSKGPHKVSCVGTNGPYKGASGFEVKGAAGQRVYLGLARNE